MKIFFIAVLVVIGAAIASIFLLPSPERSADNSDVLAAAGMHWHPQLEIYVKGEKIEIPQDIGLGAIHKPIHTHDDSGQGIIHMEFPGLVRRQDAALGQFFNNWNKDVGSFGTNMKMTVNGQENTEYENYVMRDGDKIVLSYE